MNSMRTLSPTNQKKKRKIPLMMRMGLRTTLLRSQRRRRKRRVLEKIPLQMQLHLHHKRNKLLRIPSGKKELQILLVIAHLLKRRKVKRERRRKKNNSNNLTHSLPILLTPSGRPRKQLYKRLRHKVGLHSITLNR